MYSHTILESRVIYYRMGPSSHHGRAKRHSYGKHVHNSIHNTKLGKPMKGPEKPHSHTHDTHIRHHDAHTATSPIQQEYDSKIDTISHLIQLLKDNNAKVPFVFEVELKSLPARPPYVTDELVEKITDVLTKLESVVKMNGKLSAAKKLVRQAKEAKVDGIDGVIHRCNMGTTTEQDHEFIERLPELIHHQERGSHPRQYTAVRGDIEREGWRIAGDVKRIGGREMRKAEQFGGRELRKAEQFGGRELRKADHFGERVVRGVEDMEHQAVRDKRALEGMESSETLYNSTWIPVEELQSRDPRDDSRTPRDYTRRRGY